MKATTEKSTLAIVNSTIKHADELSLRMYHLGEILKLAAFAAESRRVLNGVDTALFCRPEIKKTLDGSIDSFSNWVEMEDSSGVVLENLARQVEQINSEFTQCVYDMALAASSEVA